LSKYKDQEYDSDSCDAGLYDTIVGAFICVPFSRALRYYYTGRQDAAIPSARVLNASMHFFHGTPYGKLIAFFSEGIATIDGVSKL
jgi:hypothetical protein